MISAALLCCSRYVSDVAVTEKLARLAIRVPGSLFPSSAMGHQEPTPGRCVEWMA
jgi:hypothetical protein